MEEKSRNLLSDIVVHMKYARYLEEENRRETWDEICDRVEKMHIEKFPELKEEIGYAFQYMRDKKVSPSMRAAQFAKKPIIQNPARQYNCAYMPVDSVDVFAETMFLLLGGTGVGYSVQKRHVDQLPPVRGVKSNKTQRYLIPDMIEGWADAVKWLMQSYFHNKPIPEFDYSEIRSKGEPLVSSGGTAPGPDPLRECLENIRELLENKEENTKLKPIEAHDIQCIIADGVLSGGTRRCLPEGTIVQTKEGIKNIENISVGEEVVTNDGFREVEGKFDQGVQELVKIHHQDGWLDCTPDHRVAVLEDYEGNFCWKEAQDLKSGDRLIQPRQRIIGEATELPDWDYLKPKHSTTSVDIRIPKLDAEMAWLLGIIAVDGYVKIFEEGNKGRISIVCNADDEKQIKKIMNQLKRFGTNVTRKTTGEDHCHRVVVNSNQLALYLSEFIKKSRQTITIPDCIKKGRPEIRKAYVSGVTDGDSSLKNRPVKVVSTSYKQFAQEIQNLLYSLNIETRLHYQERSQDNWEDIYDVVVVNKSSKKELLKEEQLVKEWGGDLENIISKKTNGFPREMIYGKKERYWDGWCSSNNQMSLSCFERQEGGESDFVPIEVEKVEFTGESEKTYDLSVEGESCFVANGILVHNSAMISLFDRDDEDMKKCKAGNWFQKDPYRARANNSAVLPRGEVDREEFLEVWKATEESNSGEPGFYWTNDKDLGVNPCNEASLKPYQFCNLTSINAHDISSQKELNKRARIASFIGTLQACYTDFHYLRPVWKDNTEDGALLGVSMTGIASGRLEQLNLKEASNIVKKVNEKYSDKLGIRKAARTTLCKPEGTNSLVMGTSSGIHAWHNDYYIRRMRVGKEEKIYKYLKHKIPYLVEDDVEKPDKQAVISVPVRAPKGATTRHEDPIDFLDRVKRFNQEWIKPGHRRGENTHNVSATISIKDDEWGKVGKWMWENRSFYNGLSVLPHHGGEYAQAPFEDCSRETYEEMVQYVSEIDLEEINEVNDNTSLKETVACSGGECEVEYL